MILEDARGTWCWVKGVKTAVCVCAVTHCPWPRRELQCGKLNVAFGNEQQLFHLHTLIQASTGDIIICQTCLHNEELSREISWRSVAINVRCYHGISIQPPAPPPPLRHIHPLIENVKFPQEPRGGALLEGAHVPCSQRVSRPPGTLNPRGYCHATDLLTP